MFGNDGQGGFSVMATLNATFAHDVATGDFNNDSFADVAFATTSGNLVFLGNGAGQFALEATLGTAISNGVVAADLNSDGSRRSCSLTVAGDSQVWIKNAGAGFTRGDSLAIGDASSVAVGQFGGNTALDLVFGRVPSTADDVAANPVLLNDGSGSFATVSDLLGASATLDVLVGDVNRDLADDIVFINESGVHQVWVQTNSFSLWREQIVDSDSVVGILANLGLTDVGDPGGVDLAIGGASLGRAWYLSQ